MLKAIDSTFESEKSGYIRRKSFMTRHIKDTEGKLFMVCLLVWNQGTITHYITVELDKILTKYDDANDIVIHT